MRWISQGFDRCRHCSRSVTLWLQEEMVFRSLKSYLVLGFGILVLSLGFGVSGEVRVSILLVVWERIAVGLGLATLRQY